MFDQECVSISPQHLRSVGFVTSVAVGEISSVMTAVLADVFVIYMKTKNYHWRVSGQHFRDYHLMLDDQAREIFAITNTIAERVRKRGGTTLRSVGRIGRIQCIQDNDSSFVQPREMLLELYNDNRELVAELQGAHRLCAVHGHVATTSLLEVWIDQAERRAWFLFEATRPVDAAYAS